MTRLTFDEAFSIVVFIKLMSDDQTGHGIFFPYA